MESHIPDIPCVKAFVCPMCVLKCSTRSEQRGLCHFELNRPQNLTEVTRFYAGKTTIVGKSPEQHADQGLTNRFTNPIRCSR
jgi:hypothetical protein